METHMLSSMAPWLLRGGRERGAMQLSHARWNISGHAWRVHPVYHIAILHLRVSQQTSWWGGAPVLL